jgi:hypothetical protein
MDFYDNFLIPKMHSSILGMNNGIGVNKKIFAGGMTKLAIR